MTMKFTDDQHDDHYRFACSFALEQTKKRGKYYKLQPWSVLKDIFGHGHCISLAIWEKYKPEDSK